MPAKYNRKAQAAADDVANQVDALKSVSYRENFLSGSQRPWLTKDGSWCVNNVDKLDFEDFSKTLNALSDEMRAKPWNGISEACQTFKHATSELRAFQEKGIVGAGMNGLLSVIETQNPALDVLDTYGSNNQRGRSDVGAAVTDLLTTMRKLSRNNAAKSLIVDMRQCAVRMAHLAQWLQSVMSMADKPLDFSNAVPAPDKQYGSEALKRLRSGAEENGFKLLCDFITEALVLKNGVRGRGAQATQSIKQYDNVDLLSQDTAVEAVQVVGPPTAPGTDLLQDDTRTTTGPLPQSTVSAPTPASDMAQMVASMVQQAIANLIPKASTAQSSKAEINVEAELAAAALAPVTGPDAIPTELAACSAEPRDTTDEPQEGSKASAAKDKKRKKAEAQEAAALEEAAKAEARQEKKRKKAEAAAATASAAAPEETSTAEVPGKKHKKHKKE